MMTALSNRSAEIEAQVEAYRAALLAAGMYAGHPVGSVARAWLKRVGVDGWARLDLAQQCATPLSERRLVSWLMVIGQLRPSPEYLILGRPYLGEVAARHYPTFYARFRTTAATIGFDRRSIILQWSATIKVATLLGRPPDALTQADLEAGRDSLIAGLRRHRPDSHGVRAFTTALFGAEATLFHLGVTDVPPRKLHYTKTALRETEWASVPPRLAATLRAYIEQVRLSLRPSTMYGVEGALREFAIFLAQHDPTVTCVADLSRRHIEADKLHLARRPSARGGYLSKISLAEHFGCLRTCFERLTEWAGDDVPTRILVFAGDLPLRDSPLPRFLDDAAAAKLLQAARNDPDPFVRLSVEFLARTGLRKGELLDLTVDAVVQIGSAYWLHVPVGKLRPLHPQLKELLDAWLAARPSTLRSKYLFIERGRRIARHRVDRAVAQVAAVAGIGHVTPHQLRHTLATQAINRGMSLEAIAALLGHRSMRMTMVYARIANRTVADEYFTVSEKVEALYNQPRQLPAEAEGSEMARLRREMHRRMLGNGYCARPVGLDCHFESICESCTFSKPPSSSCRRSSANVTTQ
jgi:integrase